MAYLGRKGQTAALNSADLPTNSISTDHLIANSVTSAKIGVDVIVAEDIAANAITVSEIQDDAVTGAKLANDIAITTTGALTGTTGDFNWDSNTLVVDSSASKVGVGTAAPSAKFELEDGGTSVGNVLMKITQDDQSSHYAFSIGNDTYNTTDSNGFMLNQKNDGKAELLNAGSIRMTIDTSGNVGIGDSSPSSKLVVDAGTTQATAMKVVNWGGYTALHLVDDGTNSGSSGMIIEGGGGDASIKFKTDADNWNISVDGSETDDPLKFYDYASSSTVMTMVNGNVGIGITAPTSGLHVVSTSGWIGLQVLRPNSANDVAVMELSSHYGAVPNLVFQVLSNGDVKCDTGNYTTGTDFAEYFEWVDGNPDDEYRAGESVVLDGEKIRIATEEDDSDTILGVITETASFIGNSPNFGWHKRFVTDDFGKRESLEEDWVKWNEEHDYKVGEVPEGIIIPDDASYYIRKVAKINPDYDDSKEYIERDKRKEWTIVGLLGQIAIKKTAPKRTNWIKLKDISDTIEQWVVR